MGIGPIRFDVLINHFGTVEKAYKADRGELKELLGNALTEKFIEFRNEFDPIKKLDEFKQKEIRVLTREDNRLPRQLKNISDPPICLYIKGDVDNYDFEKEFFFGVVGTRKQTSYGEQIGYKFAFDLAYSGFIIVSGLALGIDAIAHRAALDAGAKTIAFMGCGVDLPHPPSNSALYERIIETGGLVISEFPPGMTVIKGLFIARNRLISGLSQGVLVIEGAKDSGALITARYAAEQGKEVFAPPAPITSEMSEAPNLLLKEGAKLVTSVDDILEELNMKIAPIKKKKLTDLLSKEEAVIIDLLSSEPKLADELGLRLKLSIGETLQLLSGLEIKGAVEKNNEGKYQLR